MTVAIENNLISSGVFFLQSNFHRSVSTVKRINHHLNLNESTLKRLLFLLDYFLSL